MSAGDPGQERLPVDLAKPTVDPNRQASVQVPRCITTAAGRSVVTSTQMSLKQVPVSVARGTPVTQSSTTLTSRPTIVPASSPVSTTYHVPRGIAAVANISAPRSAVATPIVRATTNLQTTQGATTSFTSGLRGTLVPRVSSPVAQGTNWLGTSTVSVTTAVPKCVSPGPMLTSTRTTSVTTIQSYTPARTSSMAVTARPLTPQSGRIQTESPRQQLIQKPIAATQTAATQSFFKTNVSSTVARTQTSPITYSGPVTTSGTTLIATQTAGHHLSVGSSTVLATPARLTATQGAAVRPVLATSARIATTAGAAAAATRLAAAAGNSPSTATSAGIIASSARLTTLPGSTGALLTTGPTRITSVPVGQGQTTRLQAVSTSSPVIATPARIAVPVSSVNAQVQQTRLAVSTTSAISPASTRHAVSSTSAISPSPGHQGTTVLATPARLTVTSTLTPGVVSLHPVVVSNTGPTLTLKSPTTHSQPAKPHQNLGPKVITQPAHGPSIQQTQVPVSSVSAKLPQSLHSMPTAIAISTGNTRTVAYTTTTTVSSSTVANIRPVPTTVGTIPVAKVLPQSPVSEVTLPMLQQQQQPQQPTSAQPPQPSTPQTATSVYIQTSHRASPAPASTQATTERTTSALPTYTLPTTYYYETGGYQVAGSLVARPYTPGSPYTSTTPVLRPGVHSIVASGQPVRFNPVMVVDPSRTSMPVHSSFVTEGTLVQADGSVHPPAATQLQQTQSQSQQQQSQQQQQQTPTKTNASPRPSILRKRDNEGSPMKAQKNLAPVLAALSTTNISPPVSPRRPDSRGNGGNSSGGSTTISATSSPGLGEGGEDSMPAIKQEPADEVEKPPVEMSPRKKPRKQQLTGNELHEPKFSEDEMEFITEERIKKETKEVPEEKIFIPKRPNISLINSYRHTWKSRHNHYLRYSDVKPKDERRPTVADLANQKQLIQKLNGWKVYHLSTQMEDLSELEMQVFERLSAMLKVMEKKTGKELDKDINRVNELIKGNMQRSKVIKDQMQEAKAQVMKIFDHKGHVTDIISRCANKRSLKKRDKL